MDPYFNNIDDDGYLTVKSRDEKDNGMFKNIELPRDKAVKYIKTHKHSSICGCLPDGTIFEVSFNGNNFIFQAAGFYS